MDLSDALGEGGMWPGAGGSNPPAGGAVWPGGATNPTWPGGAPAQPAWPGQGGGPAQPAWPGQGGPQNPAQPTWPGQGGPQNPAQPTWPGGAGAPAQPTWPGPGGPGGAPAQPTWPGPGGPGGAQTPAQPTWPGPGGPGGAQTPAQPTWPGPGGPTPAAPSVSMKVPFDQKLPNGVFDKLLITIKGTVKPRPNMITMDFRSSHDLAFHFNVRFNEGGKKVIVRNSEISKKWGKEERDGAFPFVPGQPFEMKVLCTSTAYRIALNGAHVLEFHHRVKDLRSINHLSIYNDVTLTSVLMDRLP